MSTSALSTTQDFKQKPGSIGGQSSQTVTPNPSSLDKLDDDGGYFLVSRGSLLRSKDAILAPSSGSTDATSDTKNNQKSTDPKNSVVSLSRQLKMNKEMMRAGLGHKAIRIPVTCTIIVVNTAAGVCAMTNKLDPSQGLDWSSVANLYDEVKCTAVKIKYYPATFITTSVAGLATALGFGVIGYDSCDTTALASVSQGCVKPDHHIYPLPLACTGIGQLRVANDNKVSFSVKVPSGDLNPNSSTPNTGFIGSAWTSTLGSYPVVCPVGQLEWYEQNSMNNTATVGGAFITYDCLFRMRA